MGCWNDENVWQIVENLSVAIMLSSVSTLSLKDFFGLAYL